MWLALNRNDFTKNLMRKKQAAIGQSSKTGVCNHAALPGQMHITRLVHGPQLHVSSSAC